MQISNDLLANSNDSNHIVVRFKSHYFNSIYYPIYDNSNQTSDSTLNNIFIANNVTGFIEVYKNTTNELLKGTFFIFCLGDLDSLVDILHELDIFDTIYIDLTPKSLSECPNRISINDEWQLPRDTMWADTIALTMVQAQCAWSITTGSPNVRIAVVDTEIDTNNLDLINKINAVYGTNNLNGVALSHGTRSAGIICAQTNNNIGVASIGYDTKIDFYCTNGSDLASQIYQAYKNGNKIISVSWSGGISYNAAKEMTDSGVLLVVAAGNTVNAGFHSHIANIPGVILVSGVGNDNQYSSTVGNSGNVARNPFIDLCAPSNCVTTTEISPAGFGCGWKTSIAAPQVVAVAALMLSVNPCLKPAEIEEIIKSTTDPIADADLYPGLLGSGRLNAYKAVKKAMEWGNSNLEVASGENKTINSIMMYDNIYVRSGGVLNFTNTTIYIDSMGIIVVEPGATLIINNSTITSSPVTSCKPNAYRWAGFRIEGSPNLDQIPTSNQGRLYLNNATIRNAVNAFASYGVNANGSIKWNTAGGAIIQAYNTNFYDNQRHLEFLSYKRHGNKGNLSHFTNCTFQSYANKDISQPPYFNNIGTMITAWDVHGVTFTACEFKNLNGSEDADQPTTDRGTGIFLYDATFIINGQVNPANCAITKRGLFDDLHYGLNGYYSPSNTLAGKLMVSRQDYTLNDRGIQLQNGVTPSVFKNHFNLDIPSTYYYRAQSQYDWTLMYTGIAGITTYGTAGALVEQNEYEFTGTESANVNEVIVSTVFDNSLSNGGGGRYRLNQIIGTLIGAQTQQNNQALQLTCNQFGSSLNALKLNPLGGNATPEFGYCLDGDENQKWRSDYFNTFTSNSPFDATHYPNYVKTYVIKDGEADRPDPGKVIRIDVNNCSQQGAVIEKENCQPTKALFEICHEELEWPDPNRNHYYMLKGRRNGISDSLDNELYSGEDVMAQAQTDLKYYSIEATQAKNNVIWAYNVLSILDSTVNYIDSIIAFLVNETDVASRKQLIATYYVIGDYSNAGQYLTALPQTNEELIQFKNYYDLLIAVAGDERNIYQLNSEEITTLQSIATTNTSAALAAQGILTLVNGEVYNGIIERVEDEQMLTSVHSNKNLSDTWMEINIRIYPNPANQSVLVNYELTELHLNEAASVQIMDITGKQLMLKKLNSPKGIVELSTSSFSNGIYFIQLYSGSLLIATQKVIIHH
jgi:hypothetical protein